MNANRKLLFLTLSLFITLSSWGQTWEDYFQSIDECKKKMSYTKECLEFVNKAQGLKWGESPIYDSAYLEILNQKVIILGQFYRNKEALALSKICIEEGKKVFGDYNQYLTQSYINASSASSNLGKYKESEKYAILQLKSAKVVDGSKSGNYALALLSLGGVYYNQGLYKKAEEKYGKALEINKVSTNTNIGILALNKLLVAQFYEGIGEEGKAYNLLMESYDIVEESIGENNQLYAMLAGLKARGLLMKDKNEEAEKYIIKSWETYNNLFSENNPNLINPLVSVADFYVSTKKYEKADSVYEKAEKLSSIYKTEYPWHYINILRGRASLWKRLRVNLDAVPEYLMKAIELKKESVGEDSKSLNKMKRKLAEYYMVIGEGDKAEELFLDVIKVSIDYLDKYFEYLSEKEREKIYDKMDFTINSFQSFSLDRYDENPLIAADLFNLQMSYKSFLLNTTNQIKQQILQSGDRYLIDLYDEVQLLRQELGQLQANVSQNKKEIEGIEESLIEKDRDLTFSASFYKDEKRKPTWQDVQANLKEGEAAVEIIRVKKYDYYKSVIEDDTLIYVALLITPQTKNHPKMIKIENGMGLENRYAKAYKSLIQYQSKDTRSYNAFWKPIKDQLKSVKKVYVSADGVYHQINLETLLNPVNNQYVIDEIEIVNVTSMRELVGNNEKSRSYNYAILIGNPDFGSTPDAVDTEETQRSYQLTRGEAIAPLPGTKIEIESVNELFEENEWRVSVYTESNATESILKNMRRPKVLHIATHGFFKSDDSKSSNPLFNSGLLLAGASETINREDAIKENALIGEDDGILTAYEAMNLNLYGTDLVILSACETGLGEVKNGEGVYGLQRALKVAGAKNILMSLWKVNDASTKELMINFYSNWLGGMDKKSAFRAAQKKLRATYNHPYYWGAFTLIGADFLE